MARRTLPAVPLLLTLAVASPVVAQALPPGLIRANRGVVPGADQAGAIFPLERMPTLPSEAELRRRSVPPEVRAAVAALDAPAWEDRDRASRELLESRIPLEDLYAALGDPALPPEARQRLVGITVDRIVNSPRGALGVRMDIGRDDGMGVRITATIPGMPAERHLEPDDLIVAIDGGAVNDRSDLIRVVQGKAPADPVRIEALRPIRDDRGKVRIGADGNPLTRRIDVTFPLGSTRELERSGDPGNTLFSDPVSAERAQLARMVRERWSPRPARVRLPSDREAATRLSEGDVDLHPEIQALRRYREAVDAGLIVYEASAAAAFEAKQREFVAMAADPALDEEERAWYAKVARRYLELIPPRE